MAALTEYAIGKVLNALLRSISLGAPGTWYVALYTTAQNSAGTATECTDGNYARQSISFNAESGGECTNNGTVTFPALAGSVSIAAVGLCDAVSSGHCWVYENQAVAIPYSAGAAPTIPDTSAFVAAT